MLETFPNQRTVKIHRERASSNFLGIKNENWQAASRDLGAHGLQLYLYLASNADNYTLALSPAAVQQAIGLKRSTYHDKFHELEYKGYLVNSHGNTYEFFEVPQDAARTQKAEPENGLSCENHPTIDIPIASDGHDVLPDNTEINNREFRINSTINNNIESVEQKTISVPKAREITIPIPTATGRKRPSSLPKPKDKGFVF